MDIHSLLSGGRRPAQNWEGRREPGRGSGGGRLDSAARARGGAAWEAPESRWPAEPGSGQPPEAASFDAAEPSPQGSAQPGDASQAGPDRAASVTWHQKCLEQADPESKAPRSDRYCPASTHWSYGTPATQPYPWVGEAPVPPFTHLPLSPAYGTFSDSFATYGEPDVHVPELHQQTASSFPIPPPEHLASAPLTAASASPATPSHIPPPLPALPAASGAAADDVPVGKSKPRRFSCACGKAFMSRAHLERHKRSHTKERPFACTFPGCSATFTRSDNRLVHVRGHNALKTVGDAIRGNENRKTRANNEESPG